MQTLGTSENNGFGGKRRILCAGDLPLAVMPIFQSGWNSSQARDPGGKIGHIGREIRELQFPAESWICRWGRPVAKPVALGNLRLTLLLQRYEELAVIPLHQEQEMVFILGSVNIFQDIIN